MKRIAAAILAVLAVVLLAPAGAQSPPRLVDFKTAPLSIVSGGKTHRFTVELALTARQQQQGLMFRRRMARDAGMLFVYAEPVQSDMWMRNTYIPLDMLFIGAGGRITKIAERTVPLSEKVIASGGAVIAVLELNAGTASRLKLKTGDTVVSQALGTAASPR